MFYEHLDSLIKLASSPLQICWVAYNEEILRKMTTRISIVGLKVLDGPMTDSLEAEAFTKNIHKIDVYSCRSVDNGLTGHFRFLTVIIEYLLSEICEYWFSFHLI